MVESVLDLIERTAQDITEAHQKGVIDAESCVEKRLYLESVRYVVLDVDLEVEGQFEVLLLAVEAIKQIKIY